MFWCFSLYLSHCLSVSHPVHLYTRLSTCLSLQMLRLPGRATNCLSLILSDSPPVCLSTSRYHISLVELLAACAEGKNVYTEIKCTSLLPLEDVVRVVTHDDCITEVG